MNNKRKSKLLFGLILIVSIAALIVSFVNPTIHNALVNLLNLKAAGDVPSHTKSLKDNKDGTYTISLDVTGDSEKKVNKANVVIIMDTSNSMSNAASGRSRLEYTYDANTVSHYNFYTAVTEGTRLYYRNGAFRTSNNNNGQVYNGTVYAEPTANTRIASEQAALDKMVTDLLGNNTDEFPDVIEISLVTYNLNSKLELSNSSNPSDVKKAIYAVTQNSGTNWEEGIKEALEEANKLKESEPNEKVYIIFMTDGEPTARTGSTAYTTPPSGATCGYYATHCEVDAYWKHWDAASDDARLAANINGSPADGLYNIFTYGTDATFINYLNNLTRYAYGDNSFDNSNFGNENATHNRFFNATNTSALIEAFNRIAHEINTSGIGVVEVNDGTTSSVEVSSGNVTGGLIDVDNQSFKYYLSFPLKSDGTSAIPEITNIVKGEGNNYTLTTKDNKTYTVTRITDYAVDPETGLETNTANENVFKFEWVDGNNPLHTNIAPPSASFEDDQVKWDLKGLNVLLNDVTYTVSFDCWPSQATLDLIADMKNDSSVYNGLTDSVKKYIDSNGNIKTNTTATLSYDDTRTENDEKDEKYNDVDSVPTAAVEQIAVSKIWTGGTGDEEVVLYVDRDKEKKKYDVPLTQEEGENINKGSVYTSIGIMTVDANDKVRLRTEGHDFSFSETQELSYQWELQAPTSHPMMINGKITSLILVEDEEELATVQAMTKDHQTINGKEYYRLTFKNGTTKYYYVGDVGEAKLTAENVRKGHLDISKVVTGSKEDIDPDQLYTFTATINNNNSLEKEIWFSIWDSKNSQYITGSDYVSTGVMETKALGEERIISARYIEEDGVVIYRQTDKNDDTKYNDVTVYVGKGYNYSPSAIPTGYYKIDTNGTSDVSLTFNIKETWGLRVLNMPSGSTYNVVEASIPNFKLIKVENENGELKDATEVSGTVQNISGNQGFVARFTNEYLLTHIDINKVWDDENDNDNMRGEGAKFHLFAGNTELTNQKVTITYPDGTKEENVDPVIVKDGTITFNNLPVYDERGNTITYTVKEDAIEGYTTTPASLEGPSGTTFTNTHVKEITKIKVNKVWADSKDQDGKRSKVGAKVQLYKTVGETKTAIGDPVDVTTADNWSNTWENLPVYDNKVKIKYSVEEILPENSEYTKSGDGELLDAIKGDTGTVEITNSYRPKTTKISVSKNWDDSEDQDGKRKDVNATVQLYKKVGETVTTVGEPVSVGTAKDWTNEWDNLPVYENGTQIKYYFVETLPDGSEYTKSGDGESTGITATEKDSIGTITITNSYETKTTKISVAKTWADSEDQDGKRSKVNATVQLYKKVGETVATVGDPVRVGTQEDWTNEWSNLPVYENGTQIKYYFVETLPDGSEYTKSGDGEATGITASEKDSIGTITITNSYNTKLTTIKVTKTWADSKDQDGKRSKVNATVQLYKKVGETVTTVGDPVNVGTQEDWTNEWDNLPVYENGTQIKYYFVETLPDGSEYTKSGDGETTGITASEKDSIGTITITNSYNTKLTTIKVTKTWADSKDQDAKRKDVNARVQLYAGETPVGESVPVGTNDDWSNIWTNLPVYKDGKQIVYSVKETMSENSEYIKSGDNATVVADETKPLSGTIEITNSYEPKITKISVAKNWVDNKDQDGKRKNVNATVQLYKKVGETVTTVGDPVNVGEKDNWTNEWDNLPVYEKGTQIKYYFVETLPDGSEYEKSGDGETTGITASEIDNLGTIEISNSYNTKVTSITAAKTWSDNKDQDGKRENVKATVQLYKKVGETVSKVGDPVEVTTADDWSKTWSGLAVYEDGVEVVYYVEETMSQESEYEKSGDGEAAGITASEKDNIGTITITNSYEPKTTKISVAKTWDDSDDQDGKRKDVNATVQLYKFVNNVTTPVGNPVRVGIEKDWTNEWSNLPVYENGTQIKYYFVETLPDGSEYTKSGDGEATGITATEKDSIGTITITNSYETKTTKISVAKTWSDNKDQDGKRKNVNATVQLYKKVGETVATVGDPVNVGTQEDWTNEWDNLPVYEKGTQIKYYFVETLPDGSEYIKSGDGEATGIIATEIENLGAIEITNSYDTKLTTIKVTKTWVDNKDQDGKRKNVNAKIQLYAGETKVGDPVEVTTADDWSNIWTNLPVYKDGKQIVYSVEETMSENSEYTKSGDDATVVADETKPLSGTIEVTNSYKTKKTSISASKSWVDNKDQDGKRKDVKATVQLYKKVGETVSKVGDPVEVTTADDWSNTWDELDVYENGVEVVYYVEETMSQESEYEKSGDGEKAGITASEVEDLGTIEITNSYNTKVTSITAAKTWSDNKDQDGKRENVKATVQLYKKVGDTVSKVGDPVEVTTSDKWSKTWSGLAVYEDGAEIVYYVEETMSQESEYEKSGDGEKAGITASEVEDLGTITITNTYEPKTTKISVAKTWSDNDDQDGKRSKVNATIQLYKSVNNVITPVGNPVRVGIEKDWTNEWNNLPVYEDGTQIKYYVEESMSQDSEYEKSGDGETTGITATEKDNLGTIKITNSYDSKTTKVSVAKTWSDNKDQDGKRKNVNATVQLYKKVGETVTKVGDPVNVGTQEDWTNEWDNLPVYENGTQIKYYFVETLPDGSEYTKSGDGESTGITATEKDSIGTITITNTYDSKTTKISVAKTWSDNKDQDGKRKNVNATIQLYKKVGETVTTVGDPVRVGTQEDWTNEWDNLPVYEKGTQIKYYFVETLPDGSEYEKSGDGEATGITATEIDNLGAIKITNSYDSKTTKISVTKTWADSKDQDGKRSKVNATIQLYKKVGETVTTVGDPVNVGTQEDWTNEWDNLPVYEKGTQIKYYFVETLPDGSEYIKSGDGESTGITATEKDNLGTIEITNSYNTKLTTIKVTKTWADSKDQDGKRKDVNATVQLYAGETPVGESVPVGTNDDWSNTWTNLPVYKDGKQITYSVKEELPEGSVYIKSGDNATVVADETKTLSGTIEITNSYNVKTTSIKATKTWDDNKDQDGKRKDVNATLQLYKTVDGTKSEVGDAVNVGIADDWSTTWTGLPVYENGNVITYSVEEILPEDSKYTKSGDNTTITASEDKELSGTVEITNSYTPEKVKVTVNKTWDDNDNQDGKRGNGAIFHLLADGTDTKKTKTLLVDGTVEFTELDKYKDGKLIVYTVTEEKIEGYETVITDVEDDNYTFNAVNKHTPETTTIEGYKVWADNSDQDGIRPEEITIKVTGKVGDEVIKEATTTTTISGTTNQWAYKFEKLPVYNKGKKITYTVDETKEPDGYKMSKSKDGLIITNTHDPKKISVSGLKTWSDNDDQDGIRPDEITVTLYADGVVVKDKDDKPLTATATKDNGWKYEFNELPQYRDKGTAIAYSVVESDVKGYSVTYDVSTDKTTGNTTANVTNTHEPATVIISGKKAWNDAENQDGIRPESITIKVLADGKEVLDEEGNAITATVNEASKWAFTFENLPKYRDGGVKIVYTVEEETVTGYTPEISEIKDTEETTEDGTDGETTDGEITDGETPEEPTEREIETEPTPINYSVTNVHTPEEVEYTVTKVWDDEDDNDGIRPKSITVNLLADGEKIDSKTITEKENWSVTFDKLPKNKAGKPIVYTFTEDVVEGYEAKITINDQNKTSVTILNTHKPEKIDINGKKIWRDDEDKPEKRPEFVVINVYADGVLIDTIKIKNTDNWEYSVKDLYKYKKGKEITYTVVEEEVEGYTTTYDNYNIINIYDGTGDIIPPDTSVDVKSIVDLGQCHNIFVLLLTSLVVATKRRVFE